VCREVPNEKTYARLRRVLGEHHSSLVVAMSPAAAEEYVRAAGEHVISSVPAAAYDDATAQVLRDAGIDVTITPAKPNADLLIEAIRSKFGTARQDILG